MDKKELHGKLKELQDELQRAESRDDNQEGALDALRKEINEILEKADDQIHEYKKLSERLKEAIAELEASHPDAVLLMRQIIDQLSFMGI